MSSTRKLFISGEFVFDNGSVTLRNISYLDKHIGMIMREDGGEYDVCFTEKRVSHWMLKELAEVLEELDPPAQHLFWTSR